MSGGQGENSERAVQSSPPHFDGRDATQKLPRVSKILRPSKPALEPVVVCYGALGTGYYQIR